MKPMIRVTFPVAHNDGVTDPQGFPGFQNSLRTREFPLMNVSIIDALLSRLRS